MNGRPRLLLLGILAACAASRTGSAPGGVDLAITHATVVDVESGRLLSNQTILVTGARILEVLPAARARIPATAEVVDAAGKYVIPGLWDAHVHLSFTGQDALPLFVAYGVTSVRDVGSRLSETKQIRQRVQAGAIIGPRIMTSGPVLEGAAWMKAAYQIAPPDHPMWTAAPRVIVSRENAQMVVDSLKALGVDLIKSRNVWGDDFLALADAAERAGVPLAGHNPNRVGMVRVHEFVGGAMLLERLQPGHSLVDLSVGDGDDEATAVLAEVIGAMSPDPSVNAYPTVHDWAKGFARYAASGESRLPADIVSEAARVYTGLSNSQTRHRLVHGDLQHSNVLFDAERGWVGIDPKGVVGELEFEIGAALRNPFERPDLFAAPATIES